MAATTPPNPPPPRTDAPAADAASPDAAATAATAASGVLPEQSDDDSEADTRSENEKDDDQAVARPCRTRQASSPSNSPPGQESGEASPAVAVAAAKQEKERDATTVPPLPGEAPPPADDDGWDFYWDGSSQAYYFFNKFTGEMTWENPRFRTLAVDEVADATETTETTDAADGSSAQGQGQGTAPGTAGPPQDEKPPAGGYNPAIHGDYDPKAWYAQGTEEGPGQEAQAVDTAAAYAAIGSFNRFTGKWQGQDQKPENHNDEAKSRRQMNAFFDIDAAANSHDGRSLKAERSGKKPSRTELKQFKEKRRAKKEEKRRAWLRD